MTFSFDNGLHMSLFDNTSDILTPVDFRTLNRLQVVSDLSNVGNMEKNVFLYHYLHFSVKNAFKTILDDDLESQTWFYSNFWTFFTLETKFHWDQMNAKFLAGL